MNLNSPKIILIFLNKIKTKYKAISFRTSRTEYTILSFILLKKNKFKNIRIGRSDFNGTVFEMINNLCAEMLDDTINLEKSVRLLCDSKFYFVNCLNKLRYANKKSINILIIDEYAE